MKLFKYSKDKVIEKEKAENMMKTSWAALFHWIFWRREYGERRGEKQTADQFNKYMFGKQTSNINNVYPRISRSHMSL